MGALAFLAAVIIAAAIVLFGGHLTNAVVWITGLIALGLLLGGVDLGLGWFKNHLGPRSGPPS